MKFANQNYLYERDMVYETENSLQYFGKIAYTFYSIKHHVLVAKKLFMPEVIEENARLNFGILESGYIINEYGNAEYTINRTKTGISTGPIDEISFIQEISTGKSGLTIITEDEEEVYRRRFSIANVIHHLYVKYSVYQNIYQNDKLCSLLDIIQQSEHKDEYLKQLYFIGKNTGENGQIYHMQPVVALAERILEENIPTKTYQLMTQEEQIELFLQINKKRQKEFNELVPDALLDALRQTRAYARICEKLQNAGFALSQTQQNNSLQHTGLLTNHPTKRILYNLSDMGAGKTLMTVEAIMLAQEITISQTLETIQQFKESGNEERLEVIKRYQLPNICVIAPLLSIQSSWLKTFEIFVETNKVSDNHYTYQIEHEGLVFEGNLYFAGFTVKGGNLHVHTQLPSHMTDKNDYLVIDEIHQFVHRKVNTNRFIEGGKVDIYNHYRTFVLSGTLSNMTVQQWYYMIQFLGIPDKVWAPSIYSATNLTPNDAGNYRSNTEKDVTEELKEMADTIEIKQKRTFDPTNVQKLVKFKEAKMTSKENYFHALYGSMLLKFPKQDEDIKYFLQNKRYGYEYQPNIQPVTNFQLFYRLVAQSVVTAQSEKVAEELFGKQHAQHKAKVIKLPTALNQKDLALLKQLHRIIADADKYKSTRLATTIANQMLNLNDGLADKTLYEVLNEFASKNTRFLEYLTTLDVDLLTKIQQSNLIQVPKLEETKKFQLLKDLLAKESEETFLIVVNDVKNATKLAKALNIIPLTKKEMTGDVAYQETLDALYEKQNIAVVPQHMIKSSLDLVQSNRLVQYQLNTDIVDIIQTQNRINRIGQTRETKAYYIATDVLQENLIELFLETYRNIKVAHKGIVELFVDMEQQIDVISDYLTVAFDKMENANVQTIFQSQDNQVCIFIDENIEYEGVVLWYQNALLGKDDNGKTILLHRLDEYTDKPVVGAIKQMERK